MKQRSIHHHNLMVIEADEIKDGKRKLVAREHCLQEQQIAIKIAG